MTMVVDCAALSAAVMLWDWARTLANGWLSFFYGPEFDPLHHELTIVGARLSLGLEVCKACRIPSDGGAVPFFAHLAHYFPLRH